MHGWSLAAAAEAAGVSERSAYRWLARWRAEGERGLLDRSSAPKRIPHKLTPERVEAIAALRRLRMTAAEIAEVLAGIALSTVSAWLKRIGLGKRSRLEPPEPPNRYERRPGQLVHVDVKKLGRISERGAGHRVLASRRSQFKVGRDKGHRATGWEFVHVMVDDHSRLAYAEVLQGKGESSRQAVGFLHRGLSFFAEHGIRVERVMSDNGSGYVSAAHAIACRTLGVRHTRIRPGRPRTNGKAERFIQTLTDGWAYVRVYGSSAEARRGCRRATAGSPRWTCRPGPRRRRRAHRAAQDLGRARLGQRGHPHHARGLERPAHLARDELGQLARQIAIRVRGHHEAPHRLALGLVGHADGRRLGDRGVGDQHRLDLGRAQPLARHVDRLVRSARRGTTGRPRRSWPSRRGARRSGYIDQ